MAVNAPPMIDVNLPTVSGGQIHIHAGGRWNEAGGSRALDQVGRLTISRSSAYRSSVNKPVTEMREPTYFVLASLLDGPLHGYAIIQKATDLSGGRVRLVTGTLYAALDRLSAEALVRLVSEEVVNGRVRRSYGLTDTGAAALRAEAARMAQAAQVVTSQARERRAGAAGRRARTA
jgi:DNA-binding PadR family transcriptional regulator